MVGPERLAGSGAGALIGGKDRDAEIQGDCPYGARKVIVHLARVPMKRLKEEEEEEVEIDRKKPRVETIENPKRGGEVLIYDVWCCIVHEAARFRDDPVEVGSHGERAVGAGALHA